MRYIRATLNTYLPCLPSGDFLRGSGFSGVQLRWVHRLESPCSGLTELSCSSILFDAAGRAAATRDRDLNFPAGQGPKAYYKAPMLAGIVIGAVEAQKINSAVYFAAAAVLIFVAAMLAGRKVQRNLKAKWIAAIFAVSMATFGLIWVLLSALNRHEAEPRTPPDYPAPSATP